MKYKNDAGEINLPCDIKFSSYALDTYSYYNPETFPRYIKTLYLFNAASKLIEKKHNQFVIHEIIPFNSHFKLEGNNVLLAFSGGLDSAYQAFNLREQGYNVILFHVKNLNYYTNGKEYQVVKEFSSKFNFTLVEAEFKQNTKGQNKKYWKENSFKNILLYSMMVDYCISADIKYISAGDDLRLNLEDTVTGTNVADAREVTLSFFKDLKNYTNIQFLSIDNQNLQAHKGIRLKKIIDNNAIDLFYSCVNPGRFNQSNHNRIQEKFNIKLEKWNCGVCRKCAFHSLLLYYYLNVDYPKEFVDFCWTKISNGADNAFFNLDLPLEQRVQNLYSY